jgi:sec-independent protein translocase protein TatB
MREAEMADLKKSFDEVREAASGFTKAGLVTSLTRDVSEALRIDDVEKPAETPATFGMELPATPTTPEAPAPETLVEATAHEAAEPLAVTSEVQPQDNVQDNAQGNVQENAPAATGELKDAKAS